MKCPCCDYGMSVTGYRCQNILWWACRKCGHAFLPISDEGNKSYQHNYRMSMQKSGDVENGRLNIAKYTANRKDIFDRRMAVVGQYLNKACSILDIGCGGGYMLVPFVGVKKILGIEVDPLCIEACRIQNISCIVGDFDKTEIGDKFDVVMAWHVLEHSISIKAFVDRMTKLVAPGGAVIIEVPVSRGMKTTYDGHPQSFTKYSFSVLARKICADNFSIADGIQKPASLFIGTAK